jgi:hypothetical protein
MDAKVEIIFMIQNIFYMKSFPTDILKEYDDVLSFFFKCFYCRQSLKNFTLTLNFKEMRGNI